MEQKKKLKKKVFCKNGSHPIIWGFIIGILGLLSSCQSQEMAATFIPIEGKTMGTRYHIIYESADPDLPIKSKVDSVLTLLNMAVSTYIPESIISRLNQGVAINTNSEDKELIAFFKQNITTAKNIHTLSDGFFDPTVMPLVNYWGFGYAERKKIHEIDSAYILSLMEHVGFQKLYNTFDQIIWQIPAHVELDFSAIAKGAAVDYITYYLKSLGIDNFLIEIGGETFGQGGGRSGLGWVIGINTPQENSLSTDVFDKITLHDKAVATSGNYRNFYEVDGQKYAHTINPKTGYFEQKNIISATIIADDCATADALATACVAAGLEKAKSFFQANAEIEGYLLYNNGSDSLLIYMTDGMDQYKY